MALCGACYCLQGNRFGFLIKTSAKHSEQTQNIANGIRARFVIDKCKLSNDFEVSGTQHRKQIFLVEDGVLRYNAACGVVPLVVIV